MATIAQLEEELLGLVRSVEAFSGNGFSIFDLNDMGAKTSGMGSSFPVVAVTYDGAAPVEGNAVDSVASRAHSAVSIYAQFVIVVAVQYSYTGQDDTKQQAFDLLDQVRAVVLGYKGVNSRPWRFIGERPESIESGDGVVFYSQVWQTTLPVVGNLNKP